MRTIARISAILMVVAGFVLASSLQATMLVRMNLGDLCDRAEKIFRGTVLDVTPGSVEVGGGKLPTMTYKIAVDEAFKGTYKDVKGVRIAEIRTLGKSAPVEVDGAKRFPTLPTMAALKPGKEYLLFTTAPSTAGLSITVGMGQGSFHISGHGKKAQAVNEFGNVGLFDGMEAAGAPARGPISYDDLAGRIRAELAVE